MNCYIIVEGEETEMSVYPAWLAILAPSYRRVYDAWKVDDDSYYIFTAGGIPSIYDHVANAVADINGINRGGVSRYDYLLVCLDTEDESREYHLSRIQDKLKAAGISPEGFEICVFEHKVCMETWFLGNVSVFKQNPQDPDYIKYVSFYNVGTDNPEDMANMDPDRFTTTAKFHLRYLKKMLAERNMRYSKNNTVSVESCQYLNQLIKRYEETKHIQTFGNWYEFVKQHFK